MEQLLSKALSYGETIPAHSNSYLNYLNKKNPNSKRFLKRYPDIDHATVSGKSARQAIKDDNWVSNDFVKTVQTRGAAVIKVLTIPPGTQRATVLPALHHDMILLQARKASSAASAANAIVSHVRDWFLGTPPNSFSSMGVCSDGISSNSSHRPSHTVHS